MSHNVSIVSTKKKCTHTNGQQTEKGLREGLKVAFIFEVLIFSCDEQLKKWRCHSLHVCVRVCVCVFVPFFSFSVLGVCMVFQGSLKGIWSLKEVPRMFQRSFKGVYRKFWGCFQEVSRVFQGSFQGISKKFQGGFKEDWRVFQGRTEYLKEIWMEVPNMHQRLVKRLFCFWQVFQKVYKKF